MLNPLRHSLAILGLTLAASCGGGGTEPVQDNTVASVTIASSATTIAPGATVQLNATAKTAAGATVGGLTPTWSSSNQAVATVNTSGLVTAVANGVATITATMGGVSGTRVITVQTVAPVPAATVDAGSNNAFSPPQVDLSVGGTVTWQFSGVNSHNVTFGATAGAPANIPNQTTGSVSRTFNTVGTFSYNCTNHAGMTGTVIVH
jgi:plastocyanin